MPCLDPRTYAICTHASVCLQVALRALESYAYSCSVVILYGLGKGQGFIVLHVHAYGVATAFARILQALRAPPGQATDKGIASSMPPSTTGQGSRATLEKVGLSTSNSISTVGDGAGSRSAILCAFPLCPSPMKSRRGRYSPVQPRGQGGGQCKEERAVHLACRCGTPTVCHVKSTFMFCKEYFNSTSSRPTPRLVSAMCCVAVCVALDPEEVQGRQSR